MSKRNLLFINIKINKLLIILLSITLSTLIAMNILLTFASSRAIENQFHAHFSSINTSVENLVHNNNSFVMNAIEDICNTEQMYNYLQSGKNIETHESIEESLKMIASLQPDCIETIKIFSSNSFTVSSAENEPLSMFILTQQYKLDTTQIEKAFFSTLYLSPETHEAYYIYVYPIRSAKLENFREYLGTAVVLLNLNRMLDNQVSNDFTESSYFVVDNTETVLYSTGSLDADAFYQSCSASEKTATSSISTIRHQHAIYYYASASVSELDWRIYTVIARKDLASQTNIVLIAIILSMFSILLIVFIAIVLLTNIYKPIRQMYTDMTEIRLGNPKQRIRVISSNEIGELATHVNTMLDELDASAEQIVTTQQTLYETELAERRSQIKALQSQINPHFLYNTLECIQGIALENDVMDIVNISSSMAKIFRYSIAASSFSTLGEELNCVKHYLTIMRIRFNSSVPLELNVPHDCLDLPIMRMTLQPIVENAFTHGLEQQSGEGCIRITAERDAAILRVSIANSGKPIEHHIIDEMNRRFQKNENYSPNANINGGVALVNINRRLLLSDPVNGGIRVSNTDDNMTCFTLTFPCNE